MRLSFPKAALYDVVGIGRNSWDRIALVETYPPADAKVQVLELESQPGGQVATTVVTMARLGARTRYLGKFGDDAGGRAVRAALVKEGIDLSESRVIPGVANQSAFIVVDRKNRTRTVFGSSDPRLTLDGDDFSQEAITSGKIVYLGARDPSSAVPFATAARAAGCVVAIDADSVGDGISELIPLADILFCPEEFPSRLIGERSIHTAVGMLGRMGPQLVCCTRGPEGAIAFSEGEFFESRSFRDVGVVDTTGAGDVFQGALLVSLLRQEAIEPSLRFANAAAALKCRTLGGQKGIPTRGEVEAFLTSARS